MAAFSAGPLVWPVSDQPKRSTVQRPGGGVQSRRPSGRNLAVRSMTPAWAIAAPGATEGVGASVKSALGWKPALASKRFTRAPASKASLLIASASGGSVGADMNAGRFGSGGLGGAAVRITRNTFAIVAGMA